MADHNSQESIIGGWLAVCFLIAVPIVYFVGDAIYEAIGLLVLGSGYGVGSSVQSLFRAIGNPDFNGHPLRSFLLLPVVVIFGLLGLLVLIPVWIIVSIVQWLVASSGHVHTFAHLSVDAGLVFLIGLFLYGTFFPLLWILTAPLLSHTLGEITYQRVRHRVLGERPRYARPLYLFVAVMCLGIGLLRLIAPLAEKGGEAWHDVTQQVYFPPTQTPDPWPKRFTVPANTTVKTGIVIADKNFEFLIHSDRHVLVSLGDGRESGRTLVRGSPPSTNQERLAFALKGEIVLGGADEPATTEIWQPKYEGRIWLRPGETYHTNVWVQTDEDFQYCGGSWLSYRARSQARTSAWIDLSDEGFLSCKIVTPAPVGGLVEFKARGVTWLKSPDPVTRQPKEYQFQVFARSLVDSKVPVRRGDRVRVEVTGNEAIYWLSSQTGEVVIPSHHYREETVSSGGTVHLRGGLLNSGAKVLVLARGAEWK